jgi:CBS domain-containing protein
MKVEELMTHDVRACLPQEFLNNAAMIMWLYDCGSVPIVDQRLKVVGMLTDRDVCMAAFTQGAPLYRIRIVTAMSKAVVTCSPEDELAVAQDRIRKNNVRRLPVTDAQGQLVGILSLSDIIRGTKRGKKEQLKNPQIAVLLEVLDVLCGPRPPRIRYLFRGPGQKVPLNSAPKRRRARKRNPRNGG